MRISWAYEYQEQYQKAANLYLEAVNCLSETEDNLNIGSVYHQLGNCYAYMGDFAKAINYYQQAVERFAALDFEQFLSNSMSELGLVILEIESTSSLKESKESFNRELILMGLEDIRREMENFILNDKDLFFENTLFFVDTSMLLRKVLGVIVLCSFTDHKILLETWAGEFLNEILIPEINAISARLKQIGKMSSDYHAYSQYWTFLYEIYILLEVTKCIGQISSNRSQEQEKYIRSIYELCEDLHEPFSNQVFKWLEREGRK